MPLASSLIVFPGEDPIKGTGNRIANDVRRVWRCPDCGRDRKFPGTVVSARCACTSTKPWMKLIAEPQQRGFLVPRLIEPAVIPSPPDSETDPSETETIVEKTPETQPITPSTEQPVEIVSAPLPAESIAEASDLQSVDTVSPETPTTTSQPGSQPGEKESAPSDTGPGPSGTDSTGKKKRRKRNRGRRRKRPESDS